MSETDGKITGRTHVRRAAVADIPQIVLLGKRFFDKSGYPERGLTANPGKLHASIEGYLANDDAEIFVAACDGAVVGVAGVTCFAPYFSDALMATELFWWMDEDARGGRSAIQLLDEIEGWAKERGCHSIFMVDLAGIQSSAPKIYTRRGYTLVERTWIRKL